MAWIERAAIFACLALAFATDSGPLLPTPLPESSITTTSNPTTVTSSQSTDTSNPSTVTSNPSTKTTKESLLDVTTVTSKSDTNSSSSDHIPSLSRLHDEDTITFPAEEKESNKQGKAMSLPAPDLNSMVNSINGSSIDGKGLNNKSLKTSKIDLSDVSMDGDDFDLEISKHDKPSLGETRIVNKPHLRAFEQDFTPLLVPAGSSARDSVETCSDNGVIYKLGAKIERDCDEVCICKEGGRLDCQPRCKGPFFRRGKSVEDPLCSAKPVEDPCCAILVCAVDTEKDMCVMGDKKYKVGENFTQGCEKVCHCESGGNVACVPRCPVLEAKEQCVNIPNPKDPCCMIQLCDVAQETEEQDLAQEKTTNSTDAKQMVEKMARDFENKATGTQTPFLPLAPEKQDPIVAVRLLSNGTIEVTVRDASDKNMNLEISKDGGALWTEVKLKNGLLQGLKDGQDYLIRSRESVKKFSVNIPKINYDNSVEKPEEKDGCMHDGKFREVDEEFPIGCSSLCVCERGGHVLCMPLECPTHQDLELLDPSCERWGPDPPDFQPVYPHCCPPTMRCISNGSCLYKENIIQNWSEVPLELSGCGQRCFCESGVVECQAVCAPLPALPPPSLHCVPPAHPALAYPPGDTCCKEWACVLNGKMQPPIQNMTDFMTDKYRPNKTEKDNKLQSPIFVTLPPDEHKLVEEIFSDVFPVDKKPPKPKHDNSNMGPFFIPHAPQNPTAGKSDKPDLKHYDYPGPFADPNQKPQPPINGISPFPFIKKHKDKQPYPNDPNSSDELHFPSPPTKKPIIKEKQHIPNETDDEEGGNRYEEYPINDPYLSGAPVHHIPYNPNGPGPGFFNPATTKNHHDLLNILQHQANNGNNQIVQSGHQGGGIYHGIGGNQIPPGADTIHVYTDGSPFNLDQLLQHIQQTEQGHVPYVPQQQRPGLVQPPANDGNNNTNHLHSGGGLTSAPSSGIAGEGALKVVSLEASSPTSLRLLFSLPSVMVGLHGRVQLRYTETNNPDPSTWHVQEFAPPGDLLATPQLEFSLGGLQPDTLYKIQAALLLKQMPYVPRSLIYTVRTLPLIEEATMPPIIPIEPNLSVGQVNPTSAHINWRPFTQDELLYIDGIQLRYREIDGKVFSGTPLIHRAVTSFQLDGLKPNTSYEVGIYFIPFLGQHTELQSTAMVTLKTPQQTDIYDWAVTLDVSEVTAWGLVLQWKGVPRPTERYVHVVRAVWRAEAAKTDSNYFTIPARDTPPVANITGLTPGTRYRVWLELFMTNGKVKTSNVKDVMTKPGKPAPQEASVQEGKLLEGSITHRGDYYNSLVCVAIVAALGGVCSLILLLLLLRRHRTASAPICSPTAPNRNNTTLPPYDTPTYKLDLQQETMDL